MPPSSGSPGPLQVAQRATVAVLAAEPCIGLEGLANVVGHEEREAPRFAVRESGLDGSSQVAERRHVLDGVVNENRVEGPIEPQRAHVAEQMLAVRVQRPAHRQHLRRQIRQRDLRKRALQMHGVVSATGPELEKRARPAVPRLLEEPGEERGLVRVVLGGRHQGPPRRKLSVEQSHFARFSSSRSGSSRTTTTPSSSGPTKRTQRSARPYFSRRSASIRGCGPGTACAR